MYCEPPQITPPQITVEDFWDAYESDCINLRPCLYITFCSPFLSAAPSIFSTFCNAICEQYQRNAFNPF